MNVSNWINGQAVKLFWGLTYPLASSKLLMSFLIFQISTFLSAEFSSMFVVHWTGSDWWNLPQYRVWIGNDLSGWWTKFLIISHSIMHNYLFSYCKIKPSIWNNMATKRLSLPSEIKLAYQLIHAQNIDKIHKILPGQNITMILALAVK